jgi:tRNA (guanine-N7-)-methyltransferase
VSRTLKYEIPGVDWRVTLGAVKDEGWAGIFGADVPEPLPLVVEIGFGRGEFLMDLAAREPGAAFVGIEYSFKRVLKMARRLARTELRNVRLVQAPAQEVLRGAIADASVSCFWINFPDPWPKKRHFKRRLVQQSFAALLERRLVPGGVVQIATDHTGYADWIDAVFRAQPGLENCYAPTPFRRVVPGRTTTAYEAEWRALGRPLYFFCYEKTSDSRGARSDPESRRGGCCESATRTQQPHSRRGSRGGPPRWPPEFSGSGTRRRSCARRTSCRKASLP